MRRFSISASTLTLVTLLVAAVVGYSDNDNKIDIDAAPMEKFEVRNFLFCWKCIFLTKLTY